MKSGSWALGYFKSLVSGKIPRKDQIPLSQSDGKARALITAKMTVVHYL